METLRCSVVQDIPRLRELWYLAFGDDGAYVDNFFETYYKPERMLVLEENGVIQSMTAWFDTTFVIPGEGNFRAAYLYAVATHPDCRGRGMSGRLLAWADDYFRSLDIPAVTTVPAEPSLHNFFGANGFRECFVHEQFFHLREDWAPAPDGPAPDWRRLTPAEYTALRETILAPRAHISISEEAAAYQAGACALHPTGGLYALGCPHGAAVLCAEGMESGGLILKELLCPPEDLDWVFGWIRVFLPDWSGAFRTPDGDTPFGMLKWLDPAQAKRWDWQRRAYLGLAFD